MRSAILSVALSRKIPKGTFQIVKEKLWKGTYELQKKLQVKTVNLNSEIHYWTKLIGHYEINP